MTNAEVRRTDAARLPAVAGFAAGAAVLAMLGIALACSQAPQPVTPKSGGRVAIKEEPAAPPGPAAGAPAAAPTAVPAPAAAAPPAAATGAVFTAAPPSTAPPASGKQEPQGPQQTQDARQGQVGPVGEPERDRAVEISTPPIPGDQTAKSLVEAARAERARRAQATRPKIVINDKTLHKYAAKGQITIAERKKPPAAPAAALAPAVPERDEKYWRTGALDIRLRWRKATERVKELEQSAADWRRRFYSQDDPYVRDGQVKPAWDRALDELRQSRANVEAAKKELAEFIETGRLAGALPGWLREGVELEPKAEKPADVSKGIETPIMNGSGSAPPVLKEDGGGGG